MSDGAWTRHGVPLYLRLLGGGFLDEFEPERRAFSAQLLDAVTALPEHEIAAWLNGPWRQRLTGAWIVAVQPIQALRGTVECHLLASETCYAGQGLCIAAARFRDATAADALGRYLQTYLPPGDRQYDQEWAIGALAWLDGRLGTDHAGSWLADPARWHLTLGPGGRHIGALDPRRGVGRVAQIMGFLDTLAP